MASYSHVSPIVKKFGGGLPFGCMILNGLSSHSRGLVQTGFNKVFSRPKAY